MRVNPGGGGAGSQVKANPARLREAAGEYAGLKGKAEAAAEAFSSTGEDLAGQVAHPMVQEALAGATGALKDRVDLIGKGFDHCDTNLTDTAKDYEDTDNKVAARMHGGSGA